MAPPVIPKADVAVVIGGARSVWSEFDQSEELLRQTGQTWENFCVNDMIEHFPRFINHAVTLHPEKFGFWALHRIKAQRPAIDRVWSHRIMFDGCEAVRDWNGSVGLLAVKIARVLGYRKVIVCGVPMTDVANHFRRPESPWPASFGFRRGWMTHRSNLDSYVKSWSGWTKDLLGEPTAAWLVEEIPDRYPVANDFGLRA